jgi:uncharacterized protein (TIGR03084 family)
MAVDLHALVDDLVAESDALDAVLEGLREPEWSLGTPAAGWSIADQIGHLAYFDEATSLSLSDPGRFRREAEIRVGQGGDFPDRIAAEYRHRAVDRRQWFCTARNRLVEAYRVCDPARRLPWYGVDMSPASSVTARLMETWAHGQDVCDALGVERPPTDRLRHIAHLGIRSMPYSFSVNQRPPPTEPIRIELTAPSGAEWSWGPPRAVDRVRGAALEFCLVVTQRRHPLDSGLDVVGATAQQWISIAQAFAGPAGPGRPPLHPEEPPHGDRAPSNGPGPGNPGSHAA